MPEKDKKEPADDKTLAGKEKEKEIKEEKVEASLVEPPKIEEEEPLDKKGKDKFSILLISGAFFLLAFFMGGLGYYVGSMRNPGPASVSDSEQTATPTPKPNETNSDWQKSQLFGLSFEIYLSDTPITLNLPGDNPVAPISGSILSGLKDPQARFESEKKDLGEDMEDPKIEDVEKDKIVHYTAKFSATDPNVGKTLEGYLIYLEAKEARNSKIINISAVGQEELSETLKHIALSFKNSN
ncbi:MAG: hypothetical protein UT44_C0059G0005 [Candidatus Levybacteria bacterium GW2011_GWA1_39_32]|nr:MAG: hypothetical protein UT44_C0059G0005 [Candidatus Levybacteria bacterium GW2011_GWA1_39_32]